LARHGNAKFGLDTSCLVALLADWHERHGATTAAYNARMKAGQRLVVAAHAVLECFSVLTRLPAPLAAPPAVVERVLASYLSDAEIAGITSGTCRFAIADLARRGVGGGLTYDAVIAICSYEAGARELLTWNLSHFLRVAPSGLTPREPA
jgi:toxin FitB